MAHQTNFSSMSNGSTGQPGTFMDLIICTHNNAELLAQALRAVVDQDPPAEAWSVLVVDNASSDETSDVVRSFMEGVAGPIVRYVREDQLGLTPARVRGVRCSTAEWVAFVDDDCLLRRDWVAEAVRFARSMPDCGGFGGRVILKWARTPRKYMLEFGYAYAEQDHGDSPMRVFGLVGAGMVVNREALASTGWMDKPLLADRVGSKLISGGDAEIALRIGARADLWYNPRMELAHIIPARRVELSYLTRVIRGLGASQLFCDALCWDRSTAAFAASAGRKIAWQFTRAAGFAVLAPLLRRSPISGVVRMNFWFGYSRALVGLLARSQQRQALMGVASSKPFRP